MTALIVENEPGIRHLLRDQLQDRGMQVTVATTVAAATAAVTRGSYEVVVLDGTLPDGSGLDILDSLRRSGSPAHVIMLSGSTAEADRVLAFERGADDYVVKPFFMRELTARVLAARRRRDPHVETCLQIGHLRIDLVARQVVVDGRALVLRSKEFDLLAYLAERPGHVFSREDLLKAVWQSAPAWQQAATVTEHIRRLRAQIEDDPLQPRLIRTVRGAGYRLDVPRDRSDGTSAVVHRPPTVESGTIIHVDGRVVFADRVAGTVLGYGDGDKLVGKPLSDLDSPPPEGGRELVATNGAGPPRRSELKLLLRADGSPVSVEVASSVADWHGRKAARLTLTYLPDAPSRLRRLLSGVLSELTEAVIITDLHFHIRSWNAAAERLYGWTETEALGRHVLDVLHWVAEEGTLATGWESLELLGRWNGDARQVARDGSVVDVLSTTTMLRDEGGEAVGIVSVIRRNPETAAESVAPMPA
jgi:PAS domain S-box-containing protein